MARKLHLGIFFGGRSCEHEVSVISARSVLRAIDKDKYEVSLIGIDKSGRWRLASDLDKLTADGAVQTRAGAPAVGMQLHHQGNLVALEADEKIRPLDAALPLLHGTFGEDGTLQGVFEMAGIAYVGCGVAASAIAMDKEIAKKVFQAAGILQVEHLALDRNIWRDPARALAQVERELDYPMFVKPANMGSSVGVAKARAREALHLAIDAAFAYDNKVLIERAMQNCREIECAVLGNLEPQASVVGEIIPGAEFYDYHAKYIDDTSQLIIPAEISARAREEVRALSLAAFRAIDARGLARADFFVDKKTEKVYLNELNTLPGFTPISMYPRLWEASGVGYAELIDRLIELAMENHESKRGLRREI